MKKIFLLILALSACGTGSNVGHGKFYDDYGAYEIHFTQCRDNDDNFISLESTFINDKDSNEFYLNEQGIFTKLNLTRHVVPNVAIEYYDNEKEFNLILYFDGRVQYNLSDHYCFI